MKYINLNNNLNKKIKNQLIDLLIICDKELNFSSRCMLNFDDYLEKVLKNGEIVVAEENDLIKGFIYFYANNSEKKEGYITLLFVEKFSRNKRVAQGLINKALCKMKKNGMKTCSLHTDSNNKKSKKLYTKFGFYKIKEKDGRIEYKYNLNTFKETNILLTSVGRRSYLVKYFQESLNGEGIIYVSNSDEFNPCFTIADGFVVTPMIYEENYISFLLNYCKENNIKAIISLFDIDLPILSLHKDEFEKEGIKVIVSNYDFIKICNDKWLTYQFLIENEFNTPKSYIDYNVLLNDLDNNIIKFPIIVKPRWGMGSISVFEVNNKRELEILYERTLNNIKKTYLKYESNIEYNKSVIFQEKIKGQEYGLDIINDLKSNYVNTIVKKKIAMRNGETDCAITVDNSEMKKIGKKISQVSKHIANLDVDLFLENDKIYVLEMNARFGGGYPFSHKAGVDLPTAIIKWIKEEKVDNSLFQEKIDVLAHKTIDLIEI